MKTIMSGRRSVRIDGMGNTTDIEQIGREGEYLFAQWLDENGLGYVAVCQEKAAFARLFKGALKRPDFLVLLDGLGVIAVDVKNCALHEGHEFTLEYERELKRSVAFERAFRLPVWYAYKQAEDGMTVWYWISAIKAIVEGGVPRPNRKDGTKYLAIDRKHFTRVTQNSDLGGLYTQRLQSYVKVKETGH